MQKPKREYGARVSVRFTGITRPRYYKSQLLARDGVRVLNMRLQSAGLPLINAEMGGVKGWAALHDPAPCRPQAPGPWWCAGKPGSMTFRSSAIGGEPDMPTYNHMFTIAFTVISKNDGDSVTPEELQAGLSERIRDLNSSPDEWVEACCPPADTYIEEE